MDEKNAPVACGLVAPGRHALVWPKGIQVQAPHFSLASKSIDLSGSPRMGRWLKSGEDLATKRLFLFLEISIAKTILLLFNN